MNWRRRPLDAEKDPLGSGRAGLIADRHGEFGGRRGFAQGFARLAGGELFRSQLVPGNQRDLLGLVGDLGQCQAANFARAPLGGGQRQDLH